MISVTSWAGFSCSACGTPALDSRRRQPAPQRIHPEQSAMNGGAPVRDGGSTILAADRAMELDGFLFAIQPQAAGPLPMPRLKWSIRYRFRSTTGACFRQSASHRAKRAGQRHFREKPWLTGLPYPCLAQCFLCESDCRGGDDRRKRSIAMAHLTFASRITNVAGTHLPYG
jgi:hypothetical protein